MGWKARVAVAKNEFKGLTWGGGRELHPAGGSDVVLGPWVISMG